MRVLVVTKIFPNAREPLSSPFNRQQFAALGRLAEVEVMATLPWFPGVERIAPTSAAAKVVGVPFAETIDGLPVVHPRTAYVPKLGAALGVPLYAASIARHIFVRRNKIDVLLGAWAYPDALAVTALGALLRVPTVIKCHGSDINVIAKRPELRWQLRALMPRANRVVVVSRALGDEVVGLGVERSRVAVVYNGVDGALFRPGDRAAARRALGLPDGQKLIVYVGRLEREKGVVDLLDAFGALANLRQDVALALVGDGAARREAVARREMLPGRLHLPGACALATVPEWLAAADVVTLPSWNEGTPNAVLEALACGRRVVATAVGGVPDLLDDERLGAMVPPRDIGALTAALGEAVDRWYDPEVVAHEGSRGDWNASAEALLAQLELARAEGAR